MDERQTMTATETIELPATIYERVDERVPQSGFDTPGEYVAFVLEEVLGRVEDLSDVETVSEVDEDEIETRLEALGYLE